MDVEGARRTPPTPSGLPVIGSTIAFARDPLGFPERAIQEHGDVVSFRFAGQNAVVLGHPDHIRHVLVDNADNYWKGEYFNNQLALLGDGLFTNDGESWRRQRRTMQPMFHPDEVASYGDTMVAYTDRLVNTWAEHEPINVEQEMMKLALQNVTSALFSVDLEDEVPGIVDAIDHVMDNFRRSRRLPVSLPGWVPTPGRIRYNRAVETFDAVVADIIRDHREAETPPDDVVSRLLHARDDEGNPMTDEQIRDEVLTLMLAGHDTTGLALTYIWYLLATNPRVEEKLVTELDTVLDGRLPTLTDLPELPYLDQVVTEALRLYPPVYFFVREPYHNDAIDGYGIPAGALVMIYQWIVHRDPRFYENPAEFRPERWTDEFKDQLHPFAYIPFGGGPRRCIGEELALMEIRLVVATIAQQVSLGLGIEPPLALEPMMSLRPKDPVRMIPKPRLPPTSSITVQEQTSE